MTVKKITVKNVYGLPYITEATAAALKKHNFNVVVGIEKLFSKKFVQPKATTIVVDQFGKLTSCGMPILGYHKSPNGVYHKHAIDLRKLTDNEVTLTSPVFPSTADATSLTNAAAPSLALLLEYHATHGTKAMKALAKKYHDEIEKPPLRKFKWLRRAVRDSLKTKPEKEDNQ